MNIVDTPIDENHSIQQDPLGKQTQDTVCVQKKGIPRWVVLTIASILLVIVINARPLGRLMRLLICKFKERFGCNMPNADARNIVTQNDEELQDHEFGDDYELSEFMNEQFTYDNASLSRLRGSTTSPSVEEIGVVTYETDTHMLQDDINDVVDELEPLVEHAPQAQPQAPAQAQLQAPAPPQAPPQVQPQVQPQAHQKEEVQPEKERIEIKEVAQQEDEIEEDKPEPESRAEEPLEQPDEPEPERVPKKRQGRKKKE